MEAVNLFLRCAYYMMETVNLAFQTINWQKIRKGIIHDK